MDLNRTRVISTTSSRYFAEALANSLGIPLNNFVNVENTPFDGGELYYRLVVDNRQDLMGKDVILVGSTHTDTDLLYMYRVGCALAAYGARKIIFVIPYLGYSTMERAVSPGEVVTLKTVTRMLSAIPHAQQGNTFLMLDLHDSSTVHYFEGDCLRYELYAEQLLIKAIADLNLHRTRFKTLPGTSTSLT